MTAKPSVRTHRQLQANVGVDSTNDQVIADAIETMYRLRIVTFAGTALTLSGTDIGATIKLTNAALVTVTLPVGKVGNGFLASIIPLGAGGATLSGTHVGGTTIAQNGLANVMTLDDGSWFVVGAS